MIIDFEKTEEKVVESFKGGNGTLIMRAADDGKVKIMRNTLTAGSSIGMHTEETVHAGEVHYCPCGHTHSAENRTAEDAEFFAIVPETKL